MAIGFDDAWSAALSGPAAYDCLSEPEFSINYPRTSADADVLLQDPAGVALLDVAKYRQQSDRDIWKDLCCEVTSKQHLETTVLQERYSQAIGTPELDSIDWSGQLVSLRAQQQADQLQWKREFNVVIARQRSDLTKTIVAYDNVFPLTDEQINKYRADVVPSVALRADVDFAPGVLSSISFPGTCPRDTRPGASATLGKWALSKFTTPAESGTSSSSSWAITWPSGARCNGVAIKPSAFDPLSWMTPLGL